MRCRNKGLVRTVQTDSLVIGASSKLNHFSIRPYLRFLRPIFSCHICFPMRNHTIHIPRSCPRNSLFSESAHKHRVTPNANHRNSISRSLHDRGEAGRFRAAIDGLPRPPLAFPSTMVLCRRSGSCSTSGIRARYLGRSRISRSRHNFIHRCYERGRLRNKLAVHHRLYRCRRRRLRL